MNSFFASVEQACDPYLRGKPVIVCGEGRTVVVTASYEARAYGIKTGMSKGEALRRCPFAIPVEGDLRKYQDVSKRIDELLTGYTDRVEMFSIDEAFMDVSGGVRGFENPECIARDIKKRVKSAFSLSCSIGIAPNKLLAKLASEMRKPDGLVVIKEDQLPSLLEKITVDKFCGIGVKTAQKLASLGIRTAGELGSADEGMLCACFGFNGHFLKKAGQGIDDSEVGFYYQRDAVKSVGHSHTLHKDTLDESRLKACLLWLCEKAGRRLRGGGYEGSTVSFCIRYADFSGEGSQKALKRHIESGIDIYNEAVKIMFSFKPFPKPVRLLGVSVSGLRHKPGQLYLFEEERKKEALQKVADQINDEYGESSIWRIGIGHSGHTKKYDIEY